MPNQPDRTNPFPQIIFTQLRRLLNRAAPPPPPVPRAHVEVLLGIGFRDRW